MRSEWGGLCAGVGRSKSGSSKKISYLPRAATPAPGPGGPQQKCIFCPTCRFEPSTSRFTDTAAILLHR